MTKFEIGDTIPLKVPPKFIARLVVVKWISVKERLPDENIDLLMTVGAHVYCGQYRDGEWITHDYHLEKITHWMPLPNAPKVPDAEV